MTKTIKKTFADFAKEEQWLNQMSAEGHALTNYIGGRYVFENIQPHYYQYAIELLNTKNKAEKEQYLSFLEEMGIDIISTYAGRAYLRKKNDGTDFAVYSDIDARIKQYQKGHAIWVSISSSQFASSAYLLFYTIEYARRASAVFYITLAFSALLCLSGILLITLLGRPYRKKIRELKKEQILRE
ncbi:MAG: DUF2812 domain-containing protein [Muricomes sp.]